MGFIAKGSTRNSRRLLRRGGSRVGRWVGYRVLAGRRRVPRTVIEDLEYTSFAGCGRRFSPRVLRCIQPSPELVGCEVRSLIRTYPNIPVTADVADAAKVTDVPGLALSKDFFNPEVDVERR